MTPVKDLIINFIPSPPRSGVPGPNAAFTPVDGVWNRDGQITLLELTAEALRIALEKGRGHPQRKEIREQNRSPTVSMQLMNDPTYMIVAVFSQGFEYVIVTGMASA